MKGVTAATGAPGSRFTLQPSGVQRVGDFMADPGVLRRRADSLADLFFPEAVERGGG